MARERNKLSARKVAALKDAGKHSDGGGLYLAIDKSSSGERRRWLFLFAWNGKRREMGLGGYPEVSLADARAARDEAEQIVRAGKDPIEAREAAKVATVGKPTFGQVAGELIEAKKAEWRNGKHIAQWTMTLLGGGKRRVKGREVEAVDYCASIRAKAVDEIDTETVLAVLRPIWQSKPETASRLRGRIENVLDAARARGFIPQNEANPARWRGHLDKLLAKRQKLTRGHHAALPYDAVPEFIGRLREREATAALCLEFTILTACRSGESSRARWAEIDTAKKLWVVPAERMKAAREHRIPLSARALAILENLAEAKTGEFVFHGQDVTKPLSAMAMTMILRRMKADKITVHGFRSSFRDWAGNETPFPRELAEAALAHVIGDKAEQAYRRSDAVERRRALMDAWAVFCGRTPTDNVVPLRA